MSHVTAQDVIRDIEFEIAQGLVVRQDLRQAIHAVKKFHSKTRREVFGPDGKAADLREIASRQFQINDMLITLLEEVTTAACSAQLEAQRTSRVLQRALASSLLIDPPSGPDTPSGENSSDGMMDTAVDDIVEAMQPEALHVKLDVRPTAVPLIGGFIRRARIALHSVALFYVHRLAQQQASINRVYGDHLLHLTRLCQHQQELTDSLSVRVASAQAKLAAPDRTNS
ncbi:MAG TPA: hypothetical protein VJ793_28010 [Anaerolineae bacterium]|nr:hypothetical protein [Anaerolineae bacterium]